MIQHNAVYKEGRVNTLKIIIITQKKYNKLEDADIKWNFQKFIIDKEGNIIRVVSPRTHINNDEITNTIESLLK